MDLFYIILVAIEIISLVITAFSVILAIITKLSKKEACVKVLSVLCVISLILVPVIMHLIAIYIMQTNETLEGLILNFKGNAIHHLAFIPIICVLIPFIIIKCIGIAVQIKGETYNCYLPQNNQFIRTKTANKEDNVQ